MKMRLRLTWIRHVVFIIIHSACTLHMVGLFITALITNYLYSAENNSMTKTTRNCNRVNYTTLEHMPIFTILPLHVGNIVITKLTIFCGCESYFHNQEHSS